MLTNEQAMAKVRRASVSRAGTMRSLPRVSRSSQRARRRGMRQSAVWSPMGSACNHYTRLNHTWT